MKKLLLISCLCLLFSCSEDKKSAPGIAIGQEYKGGVIFYIDASGQHGLIASFSRYEAPWGCENTLLPGANGTDYGTGSQNTVDIVNSCSQTSIAAKLCADCTDGGYTDWYLPSRSELSLLHLNKMSMTRISLYDNFWSSTQYSRYGAWAQYFGGNPGQVSADVVDKSYIYFVCPIRSF